MRVEPNKKTLGGRRHPPPHGNADRDMLPSQKALDFLTKGAPAQQRIQQFGRLTPIGSGSSTFGAVPRGTKKGDF